MKRTPLKPGTKGLKRGGRLKPRSDRTAAIYRDVRVPLVRQILMERPTCERCGRNPSVDVHEKLSRGRSGGVRSTEWLDPKNCVALCRDCHIEVTEDPEGALRDGWLDRWTEPD